MQINIDRGWEIFDPQDDFPTDYSHRITDNYDIDHNSSITINLEWECTKFNFEFLYQLCDRTGCRPDNIKIITGNFKIFRYYDDWKRKVRPNDSDIQFEVSMLFPVFYSQTLFDKLHEEHRPLDRTVIAKQRNFDKAFNFLVGNNRASRVSAFKRIIDRDLTHRGLIAFNTDGNKGLNGEKIDVDLPIKLDLEYDTMAQKDAVIGATVNSVQFRHGDPGYVHKNYFNDIISNSLVSLVCETEIGLPDDNVYDNQEPIYTTYQNGFITEKTFRTFMHGQPMLWISSTYTLDFLKYMGFKTFDKWWDESYDTIHDPIKRIDAVIDQLEYLCSLSADELNKIYVDMMPTLYYNRQKLDNLYKKPVFNKRNYFEYSRNWQFNSIMDLLK